MNDKRPLAIRRTAKARSDLVEIWSYIAEQNPDAADRVLDEIERICRPVATMPRIGRERPDIRPGLRSFGVMSWIVFYSIDLEFIEIVRVSHGARDLDEVYI